MRVSLFIASVLACAGLAGCAQVQVKSLATAPGEMQAFEVRGRSWPELTAQVNKLCPHGNEVLRAYQGTAHIEGQQSPLLGEYQKIVNGLGVGSAHSAQALVQCKPPVERRAGPAAANCPCGVLRQSADDRMVGSSAADVCAPWPAGGALAAPAPR
jgi:hypothetical protein